jgi:hypothetical protein
MTDYERPVVIKSFMLAIYSYAMPSKYESYSASVNLTRYWPAQEARPASVVLRIADLAINPHHSILMIWEMSLILLVQ